MSLKHALLGFLNYGPMTGYDLKKLFDASVGHFWNAELSHIYPTLKQMEAEGLVGMSVEVQEDRPNRKVYSITDGGRRELVDWLASPAEREQLREPVLIKVFFGSSLPRDQLIAVLRERQAQLRAYSHYLEAAQAFIHQFAAAVGLEHEAPFWALTTKCGLKATRAELEWTEEAIQMVESMGPPDGHHAHAADEERIHVKQAIEVLERLSTVMPVAASTLKQKGED